MVKERAAQNLRERLAGNAYPGRGIVLGRSMGGEWVQVYWIMGRSANSRNRVLAWEDGVLRTRAANPSKMADPSLIVYSAMRASGRRYLVSNGAQTDALWAGMERGKGFVESLREWRHEPDAPHYTPRISGMIDLDREEAWLAIIRASPFGAGHSEQHFFRYQYVEPGYGYAITTYQGDGEPLPPFEGSPYLLTLEGEPGEAGARLWEALDEDNRISLAVRCIDPAGEEVRVEIINKYQSV
jgi:IMP cyclohydrolase